MKPDWKEWIKKYGSLIGACFIVLAVTAFGVVQWTAVPEEMEPVYYFMEQEIPDRIELELCEAVSAKVTGEARAAIEAEARKRPAYISSFGTLNVRSAPSKEAEIVGTFVFKQEITLTEDPEGEFYAVLGTDSETGEEITGFCYSEYVSLEPVPQSWVVLSVPSFKQFDPAWKNIRIGGYETIHTAGCTTTCLAMVESYLISYRTPATQAANTWYNYDGCLSFSSQYTPYTGDDALRIVYNKLHEGRPVLYSRTNTTGVSHWVVVYGYLGDGETLNWGDFMINDPGADDRFNIAAFAKDYPYFNKIVYPNY